MATDRRLRTDLLKKLDVTPQRLSQLVAQVKRLYGPMSTEEGTYVLAHQRGMDITRYLDAPLVDRIRGMLPSGTRAPAAAGTKSRARPAATKPVRIAPKLEVVDAMLPTTVAMDAARMADIYPKMYVLENSLRNVISRVLRGKHGKQWWDACAPTDVRKRVADRKDAEARKPWHGKRGSHEIYYSDFADLRRLLVANWDEFSSIFPSQQWITQKLEELEAPRNVMAHNNPVSERDAKRIEVYSDDWIALINERRDLVP